MRMTPWPAGLIALIALVASGCSQAPESTAGTGAVPVILVTGATGTQGGAVARELLSRGYQVRALTRNPGQPAAAALAALGADVVQGNYDDTESLQRAMEGATGVFAVTDFWEHGKAREIEHGRALIAAAEDSGVGHFVFSSVAGADDDTGLAHFDSKLEIEQTLADSDLAYTVLRPVEFMDNWRYAREALMNGQYINPRSANQPHQWIAASDIGFFAAEAFDNPDTWTGRVVEIAGDELTLRELVAVMSDVLGRPVEHVQVSWEDYESEAGAEITAMQRWFSEYGYDVNVEELRRQYPNLLTVRDWLQAFADDAG